MKARLNVTVSGHLKEWFDEYCDHELFARQRIVEAAVLHFLLQDRATQRQMCTDFHLWETDQEFEEVMIKLGFDGIG